jgi:hypothetical protein
LAFLAYLVEKKVFNKIKVSYLIVGHTHEDIDQIFSRIGRYIRRTLQEILTVPAFVAALHDSFASKKGSQPPKCVEHLRYCYNTLSLAHLLDKDLARFALPEKSGDNVHYFLMRRNPQGKAVMQCNKLKRYSDSLWPRKYNPGQRYLSKKHGPGIIRDCQPFKDGSTKEKFWHYTVQLDTANAEGHFEEIVFKHHACNCTITAFPYQKALPVCFPWLHMPEAFRAHFR